jgi:1-pyrroline-5-carboxylate dehydrogenase
LTTFNAILYARLASIFNSIQLSESPEAELPGQWAKRARPAELGGPTAAAVPRLERPSNEPAQLYDAGSPERARLDSELRALRDTSREIPLVIGGGEVFTGTTADAVIPHDHSHVLAQVHQAGEPEVEAAIGAARDAWQDWHRWSWAERAAVFLRAAALVTGPYRERLVAATMLDQSKTVSEAEADAACELADFLRFNVYNLTRMLEEQPGSTSDAWNRMEYRALEGFVYAVSPFNFTAIGGHLPTVPALLGNTVLWKPSSHSMLAASVIMDLLRDAGMPDGVINLVYGDPQVVSGVCLAAPHLAGVHFTGSTEVFRSIWRQVGANMDGYRGFPRLVGETGGKDFILAHPSADAEAVATAVVRGAFEYQGQKCSAASRLYISESLWPEVSERLREHIRAIQVGDVADPATYMGAVINEAALDRHRAALADAASAPDSHILAGGATDGEQGWFVDPTLIETRDPGFRLLRDELFGPIVTTYVYADARWDGTLDLIDGTGEFALTGSVFGRDQAAVRQAQRDLEYCAGNLYVNDKPTGAIVGEHPFGGGRASGTNDKTGTIWHLSRWTSIRTVKETHLAPREMPSSDGASGTLVRAAAASQ